MPKLTPVRLVAVPGVEPVIGRYKPAKMRGSAALKAQREVERVGRKEILRRRDEFRERIRRVKERQIDIGMTLDERILDYLEREDGYRWTTDIAAAIGVVDEVGVGRRCAELYWENKNGMQRVVDWRGCIQYTKK